MYVPDLTEIPNLNPYSYNNPSYHKQETPSQFGAQKALAVGWLGNTVERKGKTAVDCIDHLFKHYDACIIGDDFFGIHCCEICVGSEPLDADDALRVIRLYLTPVIKWRNEEQVLRGHGHYLILYEKDIYICPELILHYIMHHDYCPPEQFIRAVTKGKFISAEEYRALFPI
jgi:hypothetical protein